MQVVILAGGLGTRLSEYTKSIPKPMIKIKGKPIICRIIEHYKKYDYNEFIIASGYKGIIIKNYFKKNLGDQNIKVVNTGKFTMTGGRIKRLQDIIGKERFMLTYGDGISDINIKKLLNCSHPNKYLESFDWKPILSVALTSWKSRTFFTLSNFSFIFT